MVQDRTSEATCHQKQGPWISREQQQQELGLFSALPGTTFEIFKLGTNLPCLKLLIQSYTRTQSRSPRSSLQGLQDFTGPAVLHPQDVPPPAVCPTLPQGAQGRAEIALSQLVQAQGLCVPTSNPCPLPAAALGEADGDGGAHPAINGQDPGHPRQDEHRAHSHLPTAVRKTVLPPAAPLPARLLSGMRGTSTHPDTVPGKLKLLFPSSPHSTKSQTSLPATARQTPRSPVLCPSGERPGAAQPSQPTPLRSQTSACGCCSPLPRAAALLPLGFFSSFPPPASEHFECADAPAS